MLLSKSVRWCVAVVGLVSFLGPAEVLAAKTGASDPIEVQAGTKFERDYRAKELAWSERVLVQPFIKRVEGKPWSAEAVAFIRESVSALVHDCGCDWPEEQAAQGRKLMNAGCDDPLLRLFAVRARYKVDERLDEATKDIQSALTAAESARLSAVLRRFLVMQLLNLPHRELKSKKQALYKKVGELTEEALAEGSYGEEDGEIFLRHICFAPWDVTLDKAPDVFAKAATSQQLPEWVRHTLLGHIEIESAWLSRGGGWGDTVTDEGWEGFGKHLERARKELVRAWDLQKDQPYAAAAMVTVVMGGGAAPFENERLWFDRAVAAQFDFDPAYGNYIWAIRPRWGGSLDDVLAFGRACRATGRYDTEVPRLFTRACNDIVEDVEDWRKVYRGNAIPGLAKEMVDHHRALLAAPAREKMRWMDRSFFAINAWLVADYVAASEALEGLPDGRLHPMALAKLQKLDLDERAFRNEIAVMASPARADYEAAMRALDNRDEAKAEELFQQVLAKAPEEAKSAAEAHLEVLKTRKAYQSGDWVKLPVRPGLPGWRVVQSNWKADDEGRIEMTGTGKNGILLFEMPPGPLFEVRGEFTTEGTDPADFAAAVLFGYSGLNHARNYSASLWNTSGENQATGSLLRGFALMNAPLNKVELRPVNQFHVVVAKKGVSFSVNGTPLLTNQVPDKPTPDPKTALMGLGAHEVGKGRRTIYQNVEIRKLDGGKK